MDKVVVWGEVIGEDREGVRCFNFLLAWVERKGAEVVGLAGADLDLDQGGLFIFVMQDSVAGAEERFGIEFLWKLEVLVADYDGVHAV